MRRRAPHTRAALNRTLISFAVASCFAAEFAHANPTGPAVAAGGAAFNTVGKTLTVTNSPNAIINWQGFSIGAGEATRFQQQGASSAVLNRVVGQDPSAILGTLWSNGKVFLVNPNGVLFGQGSRIDVAGLVASTLNLTDRDFLAGRLNFQAGTVAGSIVNQGEIVSASGGRIYLIAPDIQNHGLISSPSGEVVLAAGKTVSLVDADVPNLKVEVQAGGEALNVGRILADGGKAGIYAGLITQRGIVRADSVSKDATGKIVFKASDTTILDEGSVTSAAGAKGGEIQVLGNKVGLVGTARVDASGEAGGGTVLIGGDYQGKNADVQNAYRTYVGPQSSIVADAITSGDGGKVIVWSDDATRAYGTISARGGAQNGNGGFVEVSGKNFLDYRGIANVTAANGQTGWLLLDPSDVTIDNSSDNLLSGIFSSGVFGGATGPAVITWTTILANLLSGNLSVTTSGSGGSGNITIGADSPLISTANYLELAAHNNIAVNGKVTNLLGGNVQMVAGWTGAGLNAVSGVGTITVTKDITTGGNVHLVAGKDISVNSSTVSSTTNGFVYLNAVGGNIDVGSSTISAPNGNSTTLSAGGSITVNSSTISAGGSPFGSGQTAVNLTANSGITVNDSVLRANGASSGQLAALVSINTANPGSTVTLSNTQVTANAGSGRSTISISAQGGISISNNSLIQASGSSAGFLAGNIQMQSAQPGSTINISQSQVNANVVEGTALINMVSGGGITINNSAVTSAASSGASVTMTSTGNILIDNTTVSATSTSSSDPALISMNAGGSVTITNGSTVVANSGDTATVDINGATGIAINGTSLVQAFGSGTTSVSLQTTTTGTGPLFGAINIDSSEVTAKPQSSNTTSTVSIDAAGPLSITNSTIEAYGSSVADVSISAGGTLTVGAGPSPVIEARASTTATVSLISTGGDVAINGNVLADAGGSGNGSISVSAPLGAITSTGAQGVLEIAGTLNPPLITLSAKNGIGTLANPVKIHDEGPDISATNTTTGDIALSFVTGDLNLTGDLNNLFNGNSAGTYYAASETGNILLGIPFKPSGASLLAGQSIQLKAPSGNVTVNSTGSISTSGSGGITLFADNRTGSGPTPDGVLINGGQLTADTGPISITGYGLLGAAACGGCRIGGVTLNNGAAVQTNTGGISIAGFGGSFLSGVPLGGEQYGILMSGGLAGSTISTTGGAITLTGTGGSLSNESGSTDVAITRGVRATGVIQATGSGSIDITGFGGTLTGTNQVGLTGGVQLIGNVTSVNGNIHVTGSGGSTGTQVDLTTGSRGVVTSGLVESTGSGSITITGTGGTSSSADGNIGVFLGSVVRTNSGSITIQGTGGNSSVSGASNPGVLTQSALTVQSTGGGSIAINGAGGTSGATPQDGISLTGGGSAISISTVGGSLGLTATVGGLKIGDPLDGAQSVSISSGSGPLTISASGDMTFNPVGGSISVSGGTVSMSAGGNLLLPAGSAISGTDVTLLAKDMDIAGGVIGTTSVTLAPSDLVTDMLIQPCIGVGSGLLCLSPTEISKVSAPLLTLGRSDSNTNIFYLGMALTSADYNVPSGTGLLRIRAAFIYESSPGLFGGPSSPFNHSLELRAGGNIDLFQHGIFLGDNNNLSILAAQDFAGNLNIGSVTLQVGATAANTGSMTLQSQNINATVSSGGFGGFIRVLGSGNQTIAATGNAIFSNDNVSTGSLLIKADGGTQSISATGIELTAGSGTNTSAQIVAGGSQNIAAGAGGLLLAGGIGTGANSFALIDQTSNSGTQTITSTGGGDITLMGGSGSGNTNFARIRSSGTAQSVTFSGGGNLVLQGGTVGNLNFADLRADNATTGAQTQTISGATGISMTGGASGGGVDPVTNAGLGNFAQIRIFEGSQSIAAGSGGISMTGGGGSLTNNFASIFQGSNTAGSPGTTQTVTVSNGGAMTLQGGSTAQTNVINNSPNNFFRGSYSLIEANGDSQTIQFPGGGAVTLTGGTVGSNNPAQIFSRFGLQTISGAPAITLHGGTGGYVDIANNKNEGNFARITGNGGQTITASSITMNGGDNGVGNHAQIFSGSTTAAQSIGATSVSLTGGLGGGIDSGSTGQSMSNFALIQSNGAQTINASSMLLNGGAGGTENFAAVIAPSQTISLLNDLTLTGGASASGAVRGGGARVGGAGGGTPGPTALELNVGGNVHLTGGGAANAGTAIGSGQLGGQPTTITMDVGGNVTLDPGTVANAGSRIGSPSSNIAGGDIAITAGGTLALNSTGPGLGTAIRTLGNVTINAAAITQGADSEMISGGVTTLNTTGGISLPGANDFNQVTVGSASSVTLNDINAIVLNGVTTSGGLTVTAGGAITQGAPIVVGGSSSFNAGSNAITLTNASNDFTGPVSLTGSSASITDANALILGTVALGSGSLVVNTSGAITQTGAINTGAASFNAGSNPITLTNTSNDFTGVVSLTGTTVSIKDANALTLGAVSATDLNVSAATISQDSSGVVAGGTSTLTAGAVSLNAATNDFGTVAVTSTGNVALTDANAITVAASSVGGTFDIVAASTSFLNGFSANNYSFSGGTYTLAAGTYNLGGTTTVASGATVTASGATINAPGTMNVSGTFSTFAGTVNVGTLNVGVGGTLSGTGTIQGNVNNVAGTVSPGASPGVLTITGNYTQGASGVLDMQIGGLVAGTDYDQLRVGGTTSLAGTLNTALINGFVPVSGTTFTLIQSTGAISGTFSTINQPAGIFNNFYGPTTVDFIATSSAGSVPPQLVPVVQNTIVSVEQVLVSLAPNTSTTNSETGLMLVTGIDVAPATEARDESKAAAGSDKKEEKSVAKKTYCN